MVLGREQEGVDGHVDSGDQRAVDGKVNYNQRTSRCTAIVSGASMLIGDLDSLDKSSNLDNINQFINQILMIHKTKDG